MPTSVPRGGGACASASSTVATSRARSSAVGGSCADQPLGQPHRADRQRDHRRRPRASPTSSSVEPPPMSSTVRSTPASDGNDAAHRAPRQPRLALAVDDLEAPADVCRACPSPPPRTRPRCSPCASPRWRRRSRDRSRCARSASANCAQHRERPRDTASSSQLPGAIEPLPEPHDLGALVDAPLLARRRSVRSAVLVPMSIAATRISRLQRRRRPHCGASALPR